MLIFKSNVSSSFNAQNSQRNNSLELPEKITKAPAAPGLSSYFCSDLAVQKMGTNRQLTD